MTQQPTDKELGRHTQPVRSRIICFLSHPFRLSSAATKQTHPPLSLSPCCSLLPLPPVCLSVSQSADKAVCDRCACLSPLPLSLRVMLALIASRNTQAAGNSTAVVRKGGRNWIVKCVRLLDTLFSSHNPLQPGSSILATVAQIRAPVAASLHQQQQQQAGLNGDGCCCC